MVNEAGIRDLQHLHNLGIYKARGDCRRAHREGDRRHIWRLSSYDHLVLPGCLAVLNISFSIFTFTFGIFEIAKKTRGKKNMGGIAIGKHLGVNHTLLLYGLHQYPGRVCIPGIL